MFCFHPGSSICFFSPRQGEPKPADADHAPEVPAAGMEVSLSLQECPAPSRPVTKGTCCCGGPELSSSLPLSSLGRAQTVLKFLCLHPLFIAVFYPLSGAFTLPSFFIDACRSPWASSAVTCSRRFPAPSWTGCSPQPSWRMPRYASLSSRSSSASSIATATGRNLPPSGTCPGLPGGAGTRRPHRAGFGREICRAEGAGRLGSCWKGCY